MNDPTDTPRRGPTPFHALVAVVLGGMLLTVLLVLAKRSGDAPPLPVLGTVPPFSLVNQAGEPAGPEMLQGKISIVDFIFTSCTSICPVMSGRMAYLQGELGGNPLIQFVSVSVDPETDTPAVLTEYGNRYGAIHGKWLFFTGDKSRIYDLTRQGFHLGLETEGVDAIIHSPKFVLVDDSLRIRGYYDSDDAEDMDRLKEDAVHLIPSAAR